MGVFPSEDVAVRTWLTGLAIAAALATPVAAQPVPGPCQEGTLPSGALSLICIPASGWNGDLVVYAHGYVAPDAPLTFGTDLPDGSSIADAIQSLGFAFAATTFRSNGLVVLEGEDDIRELVAAFPATAGQTAERTYLTGASQGGQIATLLIEQSPELFSGGLALCAPIGNYRQQLNYTANLRTLFDYFFPGVLPPSTISIPQEVIDQWESTYLPAVEAALASDPAATAQLIRTSNADTEKTAPQTAADTAVNVLWFNVFGTNDAAAKLGGNSYDNTRRLYRGSSDDRTLNASVARYAADPAALQALPPYETTGRVTIPLVTLHTTDDEIVPYWNELFYRAKRETSGQGRLTQIPVRRYGHCNFTAAEILGALGLLVKQVSGREPPGLTVRFDPTQVNQEFEQLWNTHRAKRF
jgi:pimeloyl-ACP methyl ester carboxylesterase